MYLYLKVLLEETGDSSIKLTILLRRIQRRPKTWLSKKESLNRWGVGQVPTKPPQKIFQVLRLKQQVVSAWSSCREAAETSTYHLATNSVAVPCSVPLMDLLVPETATSPKIGIKKENRRLRRRCIVIYSCLSFRKGFLIAFRSGVISGPDTGLASHVRSSLASWSSIHQPIPSCITAEDKTGKTLGKCLQQSLQILGRAEKINK